MNKIALLLAIALGIPTVTSAATPLGEKDESDFVREARTFHIMFASESDARHARDRLAGRSGADLFQAFKKIAKAQSKDPASAASGGDLGVIKEGEMVKSFEHALFALPAKTVSEPVKSEFGWHLIYATDFKEVSVAEICSKSLAESIKAADTAEREKLMAAVSIPASEYAARIAHMLGPKWGPPLKDWDGNLAFVRIEPSNTRSGTSTAIVHSEYSLAVLASASSACRRSARQKYTIDCDTRLASATTRSEYEGRGASGRRLIESHATAANQAVYASSSGFFGKLVNLACGMQMLR